MPVVLRVKGYRFWFYGADLDEPPHVHVGKAGQEAKYWLEPISLARSRGFTQTDLYEIERIIADFRIDLVQAWEKEQAKRG